jgi:hypothetical protein
VIGWLALPLIYVLFVEWQRRIPISMRYSFVFSRLLRLVVPKRMIAITLWTTVWLLYPTVRLSASGYAHERQHVRQWLAHPYLFPLWYALASFDAWRRGLDSYRANKYEIEARLVSSGVR